jgi:hypothetical protein
VKPTRENWRAVPGYEGIYEVSDQGRVRGLERLTSHGRLQEGRFLHGNVELGYRKVALSKLGRQKKFRVHRLVMMAFVGPLPDGMVTRHLNGIKADNRLENLQYGTQLENVRDILAHGNHGMASKTKCKNNHPLVWSEGRNQRYCPTCTNEKLRLYARNNAVKSRQKLADGIEIDTANERWVPIPGYEGEYSASDQGRIRSEERYVNGRWGQLHVKSKIMVGGMANGYRMVGLMTEGKQKSITVHSLILLAFVGQRPEGLVIRHLNDNRIDNRLVNLQYGTQEENWEDRRRNEAISSRSA